MSNKSTLYFAVNGRFMPVKSAGNFCDFHFLFEPTFDLLTLNEG